MDIALDKASETQASLKITLKPEDYKPEVDKKLKQYGKTVAMKGFRPGHVPASLIQKMYGKSILVDEINNLLGRTVSNYIRENKLQVVGDPIPDRTEAKSIDWDNQTEFVFSYTLGMASEFDIHFDQLPSVTEYTITASDKDVNETIDNLRQQFHKHEHAEEAAEGDTIFGELKQLTGATEGDAEPFSAKTALPLKQVDADYLPTFIGKKKGETFTFDIAAAFPDDKSRAHATGLKPEEAAQLSGDFEFTIEDVTRHAPADIDQDLFDKSLGAGQVDSEEAFREKVTEIISGNFSREAKSMLRYDIERILLENIPILLPEEFLKDWLVENNEGKVSREQVDEQFEDFAKSVKLQLIKNKIAEQTDIKVEFAEVLAATEQMVREQFGFANSDDDEINKTVERIARNYLADDKNNGQNYTTLYNRIYDDKVLDYAKTQVNVDPKEVSFDEFKEIAQNR
nr:trigger factor [uncultured Arsenicibacter sp.]